MPLSLLVRLGLLGIVGAIVQITAISQISLLGTTADITPLIVVSVGLLCGSIVGASMGFGMGLFVDVALLQTLGVSSLIFTLIGYGAGRLREVRDPQHGLIPLAVGAAATALAALGFGLFQFLLGGEAPVSMELVRQVLATVAVNALLALPVFALVRWIVAPALPEDPRRRRGRRASTTSRRLSPFSNA
jgi:rod shape-determining protein MreD